MLAAADAADAAEEQHTGKGDNGLAIDDPADDDKLPPARTALVEAQVDVDMDDVDDGDVADPPIPPLIPPPPSSRIPPRLPTNMPPPVPARPVMVVPPRVPPVRIPSVVPPPPVPRASNQLSAQTITVPPAADDGHGDERTGPPEPPPASRLTPRPRRGSSQQPAPGVEKGGPPPTIIATGEIELGPRPDIAHLSEGGVEVNVATPNIVVDQPLEAHLESPTVVDRALAELGDSGSEARADALAREIESTSDAAAAAFLAYELGEYCERRLADEARAVKAFGRSLQLDPSLRANLWAIRTVFYRRGLWPNLVKLIAAEVAYARDDLERADLLLEKALVASHKLNDAAEARSALDEAVRIAPQHQGALLELERVLARSSDVPGLLDVWERLAETVEVPARKIGYFLDVGRTAASSAGGKDYARAQEAFDAAIQLAVATSPAVAERVARERLRIAEEHGTTEDVAAALDALATLLLATLGGLAGTEPPPHGDDSPDSRAAQLRREIVALRRRQAQLARAETPERAWDVLQQALALSPGESLVLGDLTELAEELGRYDDLAELVQSWQSVEGDPGRAMVLSIRRADALLRGGQRDQARALLASLEASAPGFIVLTSAAERDAIGRADPGDLARTYLTAASSALLGTWLGPGQPPAPDPGAAAALYVQAAELFAYEVGGVEALEEARSALGKALEAMPGYPAAIEALTELDDATGNLSDALSRLETLADKADGDARRNIVERAIRLARSHGDLEAVLALEYRLAELAPTELWIKWRIETTLGQLGRDDDRAHLLGELAAAETDPTRKGLALLSAARLRERSGAVEGATDLYRQVLEVWPSDTFSRESLVDLLRAQERWAELVSERRAEAKGLPDGPAARRALREAAWVLEVRLGDAAGAAAVYDDWAARMPEDRTALEGLARTRAVAGDRPGEVAARRAMTDLDATPETQWLLGRALERAGQLDEAAEVFRLLAGREDPSVASTSAAFALGELAAARGDTVARVDATAALAQRTTEPRLGAALAEDSGWMYALVLEDFERAAQSFAAAITLDPTRRGALLGAALVAARSSDQAALQGAYEGLANAIAMPDAAAALHLRAAAMAASSGDVELANRRVAAARAAAPDDTSALLVVAETTAMPHVDAADADAAVDPLLARAEVLEMRAALADDPAARSSWELDRAEALELAGRLREAGMVVAGVLATTPSDLRALEALRRLSKRANDLQTWAQASYQLARVLGDPAAKLALLRDAAGVIDDRVTHAAGDQALAIYKRIVQVEPGAPELERLLELLRERADVQGLISALTDRLSWLEAESDIERSKEMVPLLLERATVLHGLDDNPGAMADLDALLDRSAKHIEALRFRADLAYGAGDVELAVSLWRRTLAAETRPQRRSEIELQLSQVLAENVNDIAGAIEQLERVVESKPEDVQLRERLLGLCLRANDFERATRELRALARLRTTPQDKARDELRLGLMLRDRLGDRTAARLALDRARTLDPLNLDVVRELAELLDPPARAQVLAGTAASFRASLAQNPQASVLYDRLAQVTGWQSDVDARWLALVGLEALGTPSVDQRQVLEQGRSMLGVPMRVRLDDTSRMVLRGPCYGPLVDLWRAVAPAVQVATGIDVAKLGFVRGDRVKKFDRYEALATTLACFGVDDVEVYISAQRAGFARALAGDTPILCIGADVALGGMPHLRWLLGRTVAMLAEGLSTLADLRDGELEWTMVAAVRAADVPVPPRLAEEAGGEEISVGERARTIKSKLSRKAKSLVQQIVHHHGNALFDVAGFRRVALAVGHRAGLVWAGDLAVALAQLDVGKGGKALTDSPAALELTAWSVSDEHARLRERLGIAPRGIMR
jgi:tetratricopeptide (TPR) repeat protein